MKLTFRAWYSHVLRLMSRYYPTVDMPTVAALRSVYLMLKQMYVLGHSPTQFVAWFGANRPDVAS